jgi:hypothetical protein
VDGCDRGYVEDIQLRYYDENEIIDEEGVNGRKTAIIVRVVSVGKP